MSPILLSAHIQPMPWGGRQLARYGFSLPENTPIGEAWTLSTHPMGQSAAVVAGQTLSLQALWQQHPEWFGVPATADFPLMIKWIDAQDDLSIQVHPNDVKAKAAGLPNGKTECWYIVAAKPEAAIVFGHNAQGPEELAACIADNTLEQAVKRVPVAAGDFFFVPAGTVHALTEGCLVLEVQQNSNTTYRLYDYDRRDKVTGLPRELHVTAGLAATDYPHRHWEEFPLQAVPGIRLLTQNSFFTVEEWTLPTAPKNLATAATFKVATVVRGDVLIAGVAYAAGSTVLLPAGQSYALAGDGVLVVAGLPLPVRPEVSLRVQVAAQTLQVAAHLADGHCVRRVTLPWSAEAACAVVEATIVALGDELLRDLTLTALELCLPAGVTAERLEDFRAELIARWVNVPQGTI